MTTVDTCEPGVPTTERSLLARVLLRSIWIYQAARGSRISPCRYFPSCSTYAVEAIDRHGAIRGAWLAARRVVRCNPLGGHGVDPVPE